MKALFFAKRDDPARLARNKGTPDTDRTKEQGTPEYLLHRVHSYGPFGVMMESAMIEAS